MAPQLPAPTPSAVTPTAGGNSVVGVTVVASSAHDPDHSVPSALLATHMSLFSTLMGAEKTAATDCAVLAEVEAHSPKAVKDVLSWASGRYAAR